MLTDKVDGIFPIMRMYWEGMFRLGLSLVAGDGEVGGKQLVGMIEDEEANESNRSGRLLIRRIAGLSPSGVKWGGIVSR